MAGQKNTRRHFQNIPDPTSPAAWPARQKTVWDVFIDGGSVTAGISGALKKLGRFPAVGDFIVLLHQPEAGSSTIVDILPRKSVFTRGTSAKEGTDQVIAANIDIVFIVTAAGHDLNARRIERYLAIAHASGAQPVIVINKSDLTDDPALLTEEIIPVASGIPVIPLSAISGDGITRLEPFLTPGITIVLIGSSGVGKSTLINRLLDRPIQETSVIRDYDGKGRHTTTVRQLFIMKSGALMIDTPGLREVGIGTASAGIGETFPDILECATGCRFSDSPGREGAGLCRAGSSEEWNTFFTPVGKLSPARAGTGIRAGESRDRACAVRTKAVERNHETRKGDLQKERGFLEHSGRFHF